MERATTSVRGAHSILRAEQEGLLKVFKLDGGRLVRFVGEK